jgi:hypothetical protein
MNLICTPTRRRKINMKLVGRLDKDLLIKVTLPTFGKYIIFHPAKWRSI